MKKESVRRGSESKESQLESRDEEEMIWHAEGNEEAAAVLPDDAEAKEFFYLFPVSQQVVMRCKDRGCHLSTYMSVVYYLTVFK